MKDVKKYIEILKEFAERKLKSHFQIDKLDLDNFETINSYLIYQTIKENKKQKNTLIYVPDKETKSQFYVPAIFTLALYNFIDNYIDDSTIYEVGDILQEDGNRYEIIKKTEKGFTIKGGNSIFKYPNFNQIKRYTITTADFNARRAKLKFDIYKEFFSEILNIESQKKYLNLPSKFKYKSVIVTDKSIVDELKQHTLENRNIHKAFPFQYIAKSGKKTDNLPMDPMIFIVNDYETARKHILDKGIKVRNITIIGSNKYKNHHREISEDLNNKRIENCLMIGSADMSENSIPNLLKWKWTLPELDFFNYFTTYPINKIEAENDDFSYHLQNFDSLLAQIENEYGISLKELYKFVRNLFPIIIPSNDSRLITQLDNSLVYFEKEGQDIVETAFYEIDEYDYEETWDEILKAFSNLVACKKCSQAKFEKLQEFYRIDYLVAPKEYLGIWDEEVNKDVIRNVISFKDFDNLDTANKTIIFLGFFGFNHLKSMIYNPNKISIILYPQEKEHFESCLNKLRRETYFELKNSDRTAISGISFKETEKVENISDLISRLFEQDDKTKINPDYSDVNCSNIVKEITFENDPEILELDENKTVLLKINQKERFEKVKNLTIGDKIRVYDNSSKEELYQVALEYDTDGEFIKIEEFSKLWKNELNNYFKEFNSLTELHKSLVGNGLSITNEFTLRNWTNAKSHIKFPQNKKDLAVLKKSIDSDILNDNFNDVLKYRLGFNRIMKSLGRRFSSEISDYIQNKKKGKLLMRFSEKQIQQFVDQNAKERIIKTIKVIDNEQ
ncbi:MAG: hypothetical protein EOM04_06600 [Clostridia bacterium]|nr:hypothetical protein [Clostridia bacterium]